MWNGMFKATKPNAAESSHLLRETGCKALERPAPLHPPLLSPTQPRYGWQCQDNTLEGSKPSVERHKRNKEPPGSAVFDPARALANGHFGGPRKTFGIAEQF